jgi:protein O-GlcNAc transferase
LVAQGDLEGAIAIYQQLLIFNPNLAQVHCNLGAIWQMQGDRERAIAAYEQALQLKPNLAAAHLNLAKLMMSLEQRERAMVHYQATLDADPQQSEAHYGVGQIALEQGNLDLAQAAFSQVLVLQPHHAMALFSLGRLFEAQGNPEGALNCYQQLFDHQPTFQTIAAYQLSYVQRQLCNWQNYEPRRTQLLHCIEAQVNEPENLPLAPLSLSILVASPTLHRKVNEHYAAHIQRRMADAVVRCGFKYPTGAPQKLRIGYVSPDFRHHPVGLLVQDLFQHHNRLDFGLMGL